MVAELSKGQVGTVTDLLLSSSYTPIARSGGKVTL